MVTVDLSRITGLRGSSLRFPPIGIVLTTKPGSPGKSRNAPKRLKPSQPSDGRHQSPSFDMRTGLSIKIIDIPSSSVMSWAELQAGQVP